MNSKRGGARLGGGRKAVDGATGMQRVQVTLDAATIKLAKGHGGGNLSLGLRRVVASTTGRV